MTEPSHTQGELLFEQYLRAYNLPFEFEKEYPGKSKRPDYAIEWNGQTVIFDAKDFEPPEKFPTGFGFYDPYTTFARRLSRAAVSSNNTRNIAAVLYYTTQANRSSHFTSPISCWVRCTATQDSRFQWIWHNAVARKPFSAQLFCGDYDTHFGIVRVENGQVEQDVTYEGSAVPCRLKPFKALNQTDK